MCGIAGKFSFRGDIVERSLVHRMCNEIVHRGPDAEGIHVEPFIGFGQRRLSIIDLSEEANPPLANEDETVWLVFNGEIYNFVSLKHELERKGHVFRTHSDTEVIVHLYEEYGVECIEHLRGMFAFALWDSRRRILFAARDRVGKKPFFYTKTHAGLTFGSSLAAVLTDPEVGRSPNLVAIDQYLQWQYVPSPLTAFEGIEKLPAAHYMVCSTDGNVKVSRYWETPVGNSSGYLTDEHEAEYRLRNMLKEAVRVRMTSDVPLGALLSGGIDSGAVVALMAMQSSEPVKTFSVGFEDDPNNELPYAKSVANRYGTDHNEFVVNASAVDVLPSLIRHYGEPFADSSAIPTYFVTQMARREVTVALTGDGGDESFSGYDRYGEMLRWSQCDRIPLPIRKAIFSVPAHLVGMLPHSRWSSRVVRGCRMVASPLHGRYCTYMSIFKEEERKAGYSSWLKNMLDWPTADCSSLEPNEPEDPVDWMMRHDQENYLPDCLMVKADVASMANSLELRSPFLDHELIELAARIPPFLKRRSMSGKLLLKQVARDLLPPNVLEKPKTGFGVPLARWLRRELHELLRGTLLDNRATRRGLFKVSFVRTLVDEQMSGKRDWSNRLWAILLLELWFREFLD